MFDADRKGHFNDKITHFLFCLVFPSSSFLLPLTGTVGKGTIIQAGKSPVGLAVQISGNQKNKLNDPGGGSFRYIFARRVDVVPSSCHMGAAFH